MTQELTSAPIELTQNQYGNQLQSLFMVDKQSNSNIHVMCSEIKPYQDARMGRWYTSAFMRFHLVINPNANLSTDEILQMMSDPSVSSRQKYSNFSSRGALLNPIYTSRHSVDSSSSTQSLIRELKFAFTSSRVSLGNKKPDEVARSMMTQITEQILEFTTEQTKAIKLGSLKVSGDRSFVVAPILRANVPTVLFGSGGLGKSSIASVLGLSVVSGIPIPPFQDSQMGGVLWIDYEEDEEIFNERLVCLKRGLAKHADEITSSMLYTNAEVQHSTSTLLSTIDDEENVFHYISLSEPLQGHIDFIKQQIRTNDIKLVVIDSMAGALGGAQNDAEAITELYNSMRSVSTAENPVATLIIDHVAKSGSTADGSATHAPIGSITKYNRARSVWEIVRDEEEQEENLLGLYHRKSNVSRRSSPIGIRLSFSENEDGSQLEEMWSSEHDIAISDALASKVPLTTRIKNVLIDASKTTEKSMTAKGIAEMLSMETEPEIKSISELLRRQTQKLNPTIVRDEAFAEKPYRYQAIPMRSVS